MPWEAHFAARLVSHESTGAEVARRALLAHWHTVFHADILRAWEAHLVLLASICHHYGCSHAKSEEHERQHPSHGHHAADGPHHRAHKAT